MVRIQNSRVWQIRPRWSNRHNPRVAAPKARNSIVASIVLPFCPSGAVVMLSGATSSFWPKLSLRIGEP